jgi:NADH dehydrogenase
MRIVILGANGQIGRTAFAALRKQFPEAEILACVRAPHLHFEGAAGDHRQRSVIFDALHDDWSALGKTDLVINCIGAIDEKQSSFEAVHVLPLLRISDHFEAIGKPRVIQVSALGASPDSPSAFLRTKAIADRLALRLPHSVVIRPSIVCTEGTMLEKKLLALKRISRFFFGRMLLPEQFSATKIQPVCATDLGLLLAKVAEHLPDERIICAVGQETIRLASLAEMAGIKMHIAGKRLSSFLVKFVFPFLRKQVSKEQQALLQRDNCASADTMSRLLGRKPASTAAFWNSVMDPKRKKKTELVFT